MPVPVPRHRWASIPACSPCPPLVSAQHSCLPLNSLTPLKNSLPFSHLREETPEPTSRGGRHPRRLGWGGGKCRPPAILLEKREIEGWEKIGRMGRTRLEGWWRKARREQGLHLLPRLSRVQAPSWLGRVLLSSESSQLGISSRHRSEYSPSTYLALSHFAQHPSPVPHPTAPKTHHPPSRSRDPLREETTFGECLLFSPPNLIFITV